MGGLRMFPEVLRVNDGEFGQLGEDYTVAAHLLTTPFSFAYELDLKSDTKVESLILLRD